MTCQVADNKSRGGGGAMRDAKMSGAVEGTYIYFCLSPSKHLTKVLLKYRATAPETSPPGGEALPEQLLRGFTPHFRWGEDR